jgi:hypothetical protein
MLLILPALLDGIGDELLKPTVEDIQIISGVSNLFRADQGGH